MGGALVAINGSNINIEKCLLKFSEPATLTLTFSSDVGIRIDAGATSNVNITNNRIDYVYAGIVSSFGCNNLSIKDNLITNVIGEGSETHGIFVSSGSNTINSVIITENTIEVPQIVASSDVIGIKIDVDNTIDLVRIQNNSVRGTSGDTMTGGIIIDNTAISGNKITDLFVLGNFVRGIELDASSIFGIHISDSNRARVNGNIVRNIGVASASTTDISFIKIDTDVDLVEITNNILEDGNALTGIDIVSTGNIIVSGNTLSDIGIKDNASDGALATSTVFIRGNTSGAVITNNVLVGASTYFYGIHWAGAGNNAKISGNKLSSDFGEVAITALGSNVDITNNTITGMSTGSIGIKTSGSANVKISGNSIAGTSMTTLIDVAGSEHSITNNTMDNVANNTTTFIKLTTVSNSIVMGNSIIGVGTYGIDDLATATTGTTISNNRFDATMSTNAINLDSTSTASCFIAGNFMPDTDTSIIGPAPMTATINQNTIGVNRGMLSSVGVSVAEGASSVALTGGTMHWAIDASAGDFWKADVSVATDRLLYFPLNKVPNGARLISVNVSGNRTSSDDTLTARVFRKSMQDTAGSLPSDPISASTSITNVGYFDGLGAAVDGLVAITTTGNENVVNYAESNYFVVITSSGGATTSAIHGLKLNFRY